jgi:hypothetical protein
MADLPAKDDYIDALEPLLDPFQCSICSEDYNADHVPTRLPECGHMFGVQCIFQWLETDSPQAHTCPLCRTRLFVSEVNEEDGEDGEDEEDEEGEEVVDGNEGVEAPEAEQEAGLQGVVATGLREDGWGIQVVDRARGRIRLWVDSQRELERQGSYDPPLEERSSSELRRMIRPGYNSPRAGSSTGRQVMGQDSISQQQGFVRSDPAGAVLSARRHDRSLPRSDIANSGTDHDEDEEGGEGEQEEGDEEQGDEEGQEEEEEEEDEEEDEEEEEEADYDDDDGWENLPEDDMDKSGDYIPYTPKRRKSTARRQSARTSVK